MEDIGKKYKIQDNYATPTTKYHLAGWQVQNRASAGAGRLWHHILGSANIAVVTLGTGTLSRI